MTSTPISDRFKRLADPVTQRRVIQLTAGPGFCYPLYYFIPSVSQDERYLIYHRAHAGEVQLYRLDLQTAESVQLTHASYPYTQWKPWCTDAGKGVLDHRSALNVARDEVIYYDGNDVRCVHIQTLQDRLLFTLPADRMATGQNCVSPDGQWFFYIHHDRALYDKIYGPPGSPSKPGYENPRHLSRGTKLARYNLDSREHKTLIMMNAPLHHLHPCGDDHLVFSSRATEPTILYTDYEGGWYTHLRPQTEEAGGTCHYCATKRGIVYESNLGTDVFGGIVSPETKKTVEFKLPPDSGYVHAGYDPQGLRFIYERMHKDTGAHDMLFLEGHAPGNDRWLALTGNWPTYGGGQKAHYHPRLVLGGQWILITAGDPQSESNHLFLVDASDLPESTGIHL